MEYNDTTTYNYSYNPYEYGWKVYHMEGENEVIDMCYSNKESAISHSTTLNMSEGRRVAEAKERLDNLNHIHYETIGEYYTNGRNRYYGD